MTLQELLALLPEDKRDEADAFITKLNEKITKLSGEVTELEKDTGESEKLADAIKKRDKAKAQLVVVREKLGLPEDKKITTELLDEHLQDSAKGDIEKDKTISTQKKDIESLEKTVHELKEDNQTITDEKDAIKEETVFNSAFDAKLPEIEAVSEYAKNIVKNLLKEGAVLESGDILYKNDDNSYIRVDGEKMDIEAKLAKITADEKYSIYFKTKASGGSGSPNGGEGGHSGDDVYAQRLKKAGIANKG